MSADLKPLIKVGVNKVDVLSFWGNTGRRRGFKHRGIFFPGNFLSKTR